MTNDFSQTGATVRIDTASMIRKRQGAEQDINRASLIIYWHIPLKWFNVVYTI